MEKTLNRYHAGSLWSLWADGGKIRFSTRSPGRRPPKWRWKGSNRYETQRANRAKGGYGVHFAVAPWNTDSNSVFVFSAPRLHIGTRTPGGRISLAEFRTDARNLPARRSFAWRSRPGAG